MRYNLSNIMRNAWAIYRKYRTTFAEALHRAWLSEKAKPENESRIATAKAAAGITEQTETWAGWKALGFEVIHESKCLFGCDLIWGAKGDGAVYKARFFGRSQVAEIATA